jgi:diguanylate cyclase (GGDEF)-like protein/putative nucleotidyltransferase with HDIG domain
MTGVTAAPAPDGPRGDDLTPSTGALLIAVAAAACVASVPFTGRVGADTRGWTTFAILAAGAAVGQLLAGGARRHTPGLAPVFLVAAALLLPPELVVLLAIVQHLPAWLRTRNAWYVQSFVISTDVLCCLAALFAARLVREHAGFVLDADGRWAVGAFAACGVFVVWAHAIHAARVRAATGGTLRFRRLVQAEVVATDLVLAALGVGLAAFWSWNPWLAPIAIAPLVLIRRSLWVPALQAEARVDGKTGLFNAQHFNRALADELARASRFERPLSLIMADLDFLRDINNSHGHLAGDAVLIGVAEIFRRELRHYDVPARFGGEELAVLLPETGSDHAFAIAERIRRTVAATAFPVETLDDPLRATVSIGVASFPGHAADPHALVHQADLAVYRAKRQGRNRVVVAAPEQLELPGDPAPRLHAVLPERRHGTSHRPTEVVPLVDRRRPRPEPVRGVHPLGLPRRLAAFVAAVATVGIAAGLAGIALGSSRDVVGLLAVLGLVGAGQALAVGLDYGAISVAAIGTLAGAALFGPRAALALALAAAVAEWSARRPPLHRVLERIGTMALAALAAAGVFSIGFGGATAASVTAAVGLVAGAAYGVIVLGLDSSGRALETGEPWWALWRERASLLAHYVVYGFVGGVLAISYDAAGLYALAVAAVPLILLRRTQAVYVDHRARAEVELHEAMLTIESQGESLGKARTLIDQRTDAAVASLSASVAARDAYTAGHSQRVRDMALAIGGELGLGGTELEVLAHAALFHDIGKLAVPELILMKPASLDGAEWAIMRTHASEGARIVDRLGFLGDAVPAIRHHHERFDGTGYPDRLRAEEIPLGARIIHAADALDAMLTMRHYRPPRTLEDALAELRAGAGTQFCPRCVAALERVVPTLELEGSDARAPLVAAL